MVREEDEALATQESGTEGKGSEMGEETSENKGAVIQSLWREV